MTAALLDGRAIAVDNPLDWPVPLDRRPRGRRSRVIVTDRPSAAPAPGLAVLHPPSLVAGVGTSTGAPGPTSWRRCSPTPWPRPGWPAASVAEVATIDRRVDRAAVLALGLPVRAFPPGAGRGRRAHAERRVQAAVGTPSVCEAAALLAAGPGGELVVTKRASPTATVAIARRRGPAGHLSVVGLGPGDAAHRTPAAERAVRRAEVVIGYRAYLDQCADLLGPAPGGRSPRPSATRWSGPSRRWPRPPPGGGSPWCARATPASTAWRRS